MKPLWCILPLLALLALLVVPASARMSREDSWHRAATYGRLYYYYSDSCGYCQRQKPILEELAQMTHIGIVPVNNQTDAESFARDNITVTPTLVLDFSASHGPRVVLSSGYSDLPQLLERLELVVRFVYREISLDELRQQFTP